MRHVALTCLLFTACDTGIDDGLPDEDMDTDTSAVCTATVTQTDPGDGDTNFPTGAALTASFSDAVLGGDISLAIDGVNGSSSRASDGLSATFTPASPLEYDTTYTFTATACDASSSATFTTASGPMATSDLEDRTYVVDYDEIVWVQPAGASLLAGNLPVDFILLHVEGVTTSPAEIHLIGSLGVDTGSGVAQDDCDPPFDFGAQDFSTNPVFTVGPTDLDFPNGNSTVTVSEAFVEATFVENGDALVQITISGQLDTRPFDSQSFSGDACTDLSFIGATCVECASDPGAIECVNTELFVERAPADDTISFSTNPTPGSGC